MTTGDLFLKAQEWAGQPVQIVLWPGLLDTSLTVYAPCSRRTINRNIPNDTLRNSNLDIVAMEVQRMCEVARDQLN